MLTVPAPQPVIGAMPPAVLSRWTEVMVANTPAPPVDVALRSSQGIAPAAVALACATFVPLIMLPSDEVQVGPMPCVPTCAKVASERIASGPLSTQE